MNRIRRKIVWHLTLLAGLTILLAGCARLQLPAIDPTGSQIFLPAPYTTTVLPLGQSANPNVAPYGPQANTPFGNTQGAPTFAPNAYPQQPAFSQPSPPPPCEYPNNGCISGSTARRHIIPDPNRIKSRGELGEIIMTPHRIIAPVGSEVVVMAGVCGGDGYYVMNQPVEWMLSNNSVGQLVEVGGMEHPSFNRLVPPNAKKFDGQYAWGRTGLKEKTLTRGTPTPADDIQLMKGQTYVSLASASPGTTYLTAVVPKAEGWDKRRSSTTIHWVDGIWSIPLPSSATAGTVKPLTTLVKSARDDGGVADWRVKYTIVGGAPAEFAPTGSQTAESVTSEDGTATVQLRQPAGQFEPGTTQVRVDIVRPPMFGERELLIESGITSVTWSAPALTIRAIGPREAGNNEPFNYRIEVTNPGDQVARDVIVRTNNLTDDVTFVSSDPKPTQYGRDYEWNIGDIVPGSSPRVINIQFKSQVPGLLNVCFDVASESDQLQTQACAETEIVAPCIGLIIEGPESARVGETGTFNIEIVNQCEEALENVVLNLQYDPQIRAIGLGQVIEAELGRLEFGQRKSVPLTFEILQPGRPCFRLRVAADGGHSARAQQCINVEQVSAPEITMQLDGQRLVEVGERAMVRGRIVNTGTTTLEDITLTNRFSDSLLPKFVSKEYPHDWLNQDLGVNIGRLAPNQEAVVEIQYDTLRADGNAFSVFTVTTPSGATATDRFEIRIENPGGGQPGGPEPGGIAAPNFGGQNPANDGQGIQIPRDPAGAGLKVNVEALDRAVSMAPRGTPNASNGRFRVTITNDRNIADENIDIELLVPPGLWLYEFDPAPGGLSIAVRNEDFTQFRLQKKFRMEPGEQIQFTAFISGDQLGQGTFEVQATSDNTIGSVTGSASIEVTQ